MSRLEPRSIRDANRLRNVDATIPGLRINQRGARHLQRRSRQRSPRYPYPNIGLKGSQGYRNSDNYLVVRTRTPDSEMPYKTTTKNVITPITTMVGRNPMTSATAPKGAAAIPNPAHASCISDCTRP